MKQTLISSLERGPYPGMRLWDVWRLCCAYEIDVNQVFEALGWLDRPKSRNPEIERRITLINRALRDVSRTDLDILLTVIERYIIGIHHQRD